MEIMKNWLNITVLFLFISNINAQMVLTGRVINDSNQEPLSDINIIVVNENIGSATDDNGFFQLELPSEISSFTLEASAVGFSSISKDLDIGEVKNIVIFKLEPKIIELDPVVVIQNITRLDNPFLRSPGSSDLVSLADIKRYNDTDVNRILSRIPGVYVQEEDGFGLRPNIGMRGTGVERSSKVNLMEDGILISPAPYASPAAYYSPTAGRMYALEARKGSSQIKYGPHSTGGALNYVSTPIPTSYKSNFVIRGGNHSSYFLKADIGSSNSNFGYLFEVLHDENSGFKLLDYVNGNTGYAKTDLMGKIRYKTNLINFPTAFELKVSLTDELSNETYLGLTDEDYNKNPYTRYSSSQKDQMDADHFQISLMNSIQLSENSNLSLVFYRNNFKRNWYKLSKVNGTSIGSLLSAGNTHKSYSFLSVTEAGDNTYQIKANNREYYSQGIQLASNIKSNFIFQHNLMIGLRLHEDQMDRYQKVDKYGMQNNVLKLTTNGTWGLGSKNNRVDDATSTAYFIEDQFNIQNFTITAGARYESIELKRRDWKGDVTSNSLSWNDPNRQLAPSEKSKTLNVLVPGIGFVYEFNSDVEFLAGIHKGFSPPGPGSDESDDIKPEESVNIEAGLVINKGLNKIKTVFFNNHYSNLLGDDTQFTGQGTYDQFNAGEVKINGVELSVKRNFKFGNYLAPLEFSYTYTNSEFLSDFESKYGPWGSVQKGDELPYLPTHQLFTEFGVLSQDANIFFRLKNTSAMRTKAGNGTLENEYSTEDLTQIDITGEYKLNNKSNLFLTIRNITDTKSIVARRPAGLRPTLPRTLSAGIKFNL